MPLETQETGNGENMQASELMPVRHKMSLVSTLHGVTGLY